MLAEKATVLINIVRYMSSHGHEDNLKHLISSLSTIADKLKIADVPAFYKTIISILGENNHNALMHTAIVGFLNAFPDNVTQDISDAYMKVAIIHKGCINQQRLTKLKDKFPSKIAETAANVYEAKSFNYESGNGVTAEQCKQKSQIIKFLTISNKTQCIPYDHITKELAMKEEEISDFIIGLIDAQVIEAKLDEQLKCVYVEMLNIPSDSVDAKISTLEEWAKVLEKMNE
jgi:hypothetical protein